MKYNMKFFIAATPYLIILVECLLWILAIGGAIKGGIFFITHFRDMWNVLQLITLCAESLAWAIIPYCLARAVSELCKLAKEIIAKKQGDRLHLSNLQ